MTDFEIISLYWKRSEEVITYTMEKYGRYLFKIAKNILGIHEEAEECVNETYMSAWNQLPPDWPERLLPYLGRISRCVALNRYDHLTAQKRNMNITEQLLELEDCLHAEDTVEQQYEEKEVAAAISAFLRTENKKSRSMFIRRYWYAMSIRQIAIEFGVGESKVKSQLFRIRNRLKSYLEKEGIWL